MSKYNDLRDGAPNRIQRDNIEADLKKTIYAKIPTGEETVAKLSEGDVVRFDATVVPFVPDEACYQHNMSTVGFVRFKRIQKIGWNVHLE